MKSQTRVSVVNSHTVCKNSVISQIEFKYMGIHIAPCWRMHSLHRNIIIAAAAAALKYYFRRRRRSRRPMPLSSALPSLFSAYSPTD